MGDSASAAIEACRQRAVSDLPQIVRPAVMEGRVPPTTALAKVMTIGALAQSTGQTTTPSWVSVAMGAVFTVTTRRVDIIAWPGAQQRRRLRGRHPWITPPIGRRPYRRSEVLDGRSTATPADLGWLS